jgi:hypothetical protein
LPIVLRVYVAAQVGHLADDAFIFFRYARNFAAGSGLVYNAGEPVLGFTSPAYVLLLSAMAALRVPLEAGCTALNLGLFVVASVALANIAETMRRPWALAAGPWMLYFPIVDGNMNGMETTLFITCVAGAVALLLRGRVDASAAAASLAALTRPEGLLFCVTLGVAWALQPKRTVPWRGLAFGALLATAWTAFALHTYGTIVPQSVLSKTTAWGPNPSTNGPLEYLVMTAIGASESHLFRIPRLAQWAIVASGLLVVERIVAFARARSAAIALPLFFVLLWLFYTTGKPVRTASWYVVPTTLCFSWSALDAVLSRLKSERQQNVVAAALAVALTVSSAVGLRARRFGNAVETAHMMRLAEHIREFPAARSVVMGDIGYVGYVTGLRVIDRAMLVSRPSLIVDETGRHYTWAEICDREHPDLLVMRGFEPGELSGPQERGYVVHTWPDTHYTLVAAPGLDGTTSLR